MTSVIVPSAEPQQAEQAMAITYIYMDKDLYKAAATGDMELFNKYKGDFRCLVDGRKNTALHIYLKIRLDERYGRDMNFVRELVEKCPSLLLQPNEEGQIPLHIVVAKYKILEVVKFIIERTKLLQNEDPEKGLEPTNWMKQTLRMTDKDGNTALHMVVERREAYLVELLVKELDPDDFPFFAKNKRGLTPLHIAAKNRDYFSVEKILDKFKLTAHGGAHGATNSEAAILGTGDEKTLRKLISETDEEGRTPLHYAAHLGDRSAVKLMLEADANAAYITDKERGTTALHMAAWQGRLDIMKDIISYCPGCCEIVEKKYGWNFLHFAAVTLDAYELLTSLFGPESMVKDSLLSIDLLFKEDVNGIMPLDVPPFMEERTGRPRNYQNAIDFLRPQGRAISRIRSRRFDYLKRRKKVNEILEEMGNNVEVGQSPVHYSFREAKRKDMKDIPPDMKESVREMRETHLVVATLVATVTFAAGIAVPGGFKSDTTGTATLSHNSAFKAFIITDALAFASSLFAIFLHFFSVYFRDTDLLPFAIGWILLADLLTAFAMAMMVVAFSTGTYAVLGSSMGVAIATCFIVLTFFPITIIVPLLLRYLFRKGVFDE